MEERHKQLIRLRDLLSKRQINFNILTELEVYFLGTNNGGGCKCKLPPVKRRLEDFWNNQGINELELYENPPQIGSSGTYENNEDSTK